MEDPQTKNEARTYYVAGKIEMDAYDNATKTRMINPDDPSAKPAVMADELMNAYKYFLKASLLTASLTLREKLSLNIPKTFSIRLPDMPTISSRQVPTISMRRCIILKPMRRLWSMATSLPPV